MNLEVSDIIEDIVRGKDESLRSSIEANVDKLLTTDWWGSDTYFPFDYAYSDKNPYEVKKFASLKSCAMKLKNLGHNLTKVLIDGSKSIPIRFHTKPESYLHITSKGTSSIFVTTYAFNLVGKEREFLIYNPETDIYEAGEVTLEISYEATLGIILHEIAHCRYTDEVVLKKALEGLPMLSERTKLTPTVLEKWFFHIWNILEDERIERLLAADYPNFKFYLKRSREVHFSLFLKYLVDKEKTLAMKLTEFDVFMSFIHSAVRYPIGLQNESLERHYDAYLYVYNLISNDSKETTTDIIQLSLNILLYLAEYFEQPPSSCPKSEDEEDGESGEDESDPKDDDTDENEEDSKESIKDLLMPSLFLEGDRECLLSKLLRETTSISTDVEKIEVEIDSENEGDEDSEAYAFFNHDHTYQKEKLRTFVELPISMPEKYAVSLGRVSRYASTLKKVLDLEYRDYKLVNKSMRNGYLDTSKLVDASIGVPTIYENYKKVKTQDFAMCLLIDQSGSMGYGNELSRAEVARDVAVMFEIALRGRAYIESYIYGHTADCAKKSTESRNTVIIPYKDKYKPFNKLRLGAIDAQYENRDGGAIDAVCQLVRTQTSKPCVMFVISDGYPQAGYYGGDGAIKHTRDAVTKWEQQGFTIIHIGISAGLRGESMFKNHVSFTDLSELPNEIGKLLKKVFAKKLQG